MKIAILGSGGREHALVNQMSLSKKTTKIYCIPGNAGTCNLAENVNLNLDNFESIYDFILKNKIELVVVGPEKPLVDGIADFLQEKKIKVFGPNKVLSQFEGSKTFTKNVCKKYNVKLLNPEKFNIFEFRDNNSCKSTKYKGKYFKDLNADEYLKYFTEKYQKVDFNYIKDYFLNSGFHDDSKLYISLTSDNFETENINFKIKFTLNK